MVKKTWFFFLVEAIFLALLFVVGLFLAPNIAVVDQTFVSIGGYFFELAIKTVLTIIIILIQSFLFFKVLLRSDRSLKEYFIEKNNNSHAIIFGGIVISAVITLIFAKGGNIQQYLYNLCIKMPIGYLISTVATIFVTRYFGIKTITSFRYSMNELNNDSYAILVLLIFVASMFLAMSV